MAIPEFTTTAVIDGNTKIEDTDDQIKILMADVKAYLEANINNYSADEILSKLLTVDGAGSGLDTDTVRSFIIAKSVPADAVFTDTTYSVGDNGLTEKNFTEVLENKLDSIETGAEKNDEDTTLMGNVFNEADKLVKLDNDKKLPVADAANLTGLSVADRTALKAYKGTPGQTVLQKDIDLKYEWVEPQITDNGVTVINVDGDTTGSWKAIYSGAIYAEWACLSDSENASPAIEKMLNLGGKVIVNTDIVMDETVNITAPFDISLTCVNGSIKKTGEQVNVLFNIEETVKYFDAENIKLDGNNLVSLPIKVACSHRIKNNEFYNIYSPYSSGLAATCINVSWFTSGAKTSIIRGNKIYSISAENDGTITEAPGSAKAIYYQVDYKADGSLIYVDDNKINDIYGREGDGIYIAAYDVDNTSDLAIVDEHSKNLKTMYFVEKNIIHDCNRRCLKIASSNVYVKNNDCNLYDSIDARDINGTAVASLFPFYAGTKVYNCVFSDDNSFISTSNTSNQAVSIEGAVNTKLYNNKITHEKNVKSGISLNNTISTKIYENNITSGWAVGFVGDTVDTKILSNWWNPTQKDHGFVVDSLTFTASNVLIDNNKIHALLPDGTEYSQGIVQIKYDGTFFDGLTVSNNKIVDESGTSPAYILRNVSANLTNKIRFINNYSEGNGVSPFDAGTGDIIDCIYAENKNKNGDEISGVISTSLDVEMLTNPNLYPDGSGYTYYDDTVYDTSLKAIYLFDDGSGTSGAFLQSVTFEDGEKYRLDFYVSRLMNPSFDIRDSSTNLIASFRNNNTKPGWNTVFFTANSDSNRIYFVRSGATACVISQLSLKKVV